MEIKLSQISESKTEVKLILDNQIQVYLGLLSKSQLKDLIKDLEQIINKIKNHLGDIKNGN
jgi:hypothetical protein